MTAHCAATESDMCAQPARGSELQKRAARLSIVMEDPQMRRPRFHAPRASLAFAQARHPVFAKVEKVSTCALAGVGKQTIFPCCHDAAPPQYQHTLRMLRFLPAFASCSTLSSLLNKFKPHTCCANKFKPHTRCANKFNPHACCAMGRQAFNGVIIDQARRASVHLAGERASRVSVINLNVLAPPPEEVPKPASHRPTKSAPRRTLRVAVHSRTEK